MNSIKRLGLGYGRLGLSTDPELIERRTKGVAAVAAATDRADLLPLVRRAFGLGQPAASAGFLTKMQGEDPTFDVQADDKEAGLLAGSILDRVIEDEGDQSGIAALAVVAAAAGGLRRPNNYDGLVAEAERRLAVVQGSSTGAPATRTYRRQPEALATTLQTIGNVHFNQISSHVVTAFQELGKYAEAGALAAAANANVLLDYVGRVELELRLYWWVTGGWSSDAAKPFRRMRVTEAALRGGKELAEKAFNEVGLFAAPAMLDMILERGRSEGELVPVSLDDISKTGDLAWRQNVFSAVGSGAFSDIAAVSTALYLAAESGDADDWHPRFFRITGVRVDAMLDPVSLGLQLYRECLLSKAFA
ncbi:hypothetical protein BAR24_14890 [Gluconobacter oxydans]|nr:hypothetical protein B932_2211 [Gluconobacter oxydans H24]ANQ42625.1 hypothetical protein BAR24_14890 [Gluconobacter oxydans]